MNRQQQQQQPPPRAPPGFGAPPALRAPAYPAAYALPPTQGRAPSYGAGAFGAADFPPLGAVPTPSYAAQAAPPAAPTPAPPRAPTPDDFPALGAPNGDDAPRRGPATAAQQVLASAADGWGLLGLIARIRAPDGAALGADLGALGLDMAAPRALFPGLATPWAGAGEGAPPEFSLPACYAGAASAPPGPAKAGTFGDETLFWAFYASPRDALQEVAAQELWNRGWRWHKEQRLWLTKEGMPAAHAKTAGGEAGAFVVWDADAWAKDVRELSVLYADLEEKLAPVFPQTAALAYPGQQAPPAVQVQGRPFQGAGIAAM